MSNPKQGECWQVDFNIDSKGSEINKIRPAICVNSKVISYLEGYCIISNDDVASIQFGKQKNLRIVVPITTWQEHFSDCYYMIPIEDPGLEHKSAVNVYQIRCIDSEERLNQFKHRRMTVNKETLREILAGVSYCLGYESISS